MIKKTHQNQPLFTQNKRTLVVKAQLETEIWRPKHKLEAMYEFLKSCSMGAWFQKIKGPIIL